MLSLQDSLPLPHAVLVFSDTPQFQVITGLVAIKSEGVPGGLSGHAALLAQLASHNRVFKAALEAFSDEVGVYLA